MDKQEFYNALRFIAILVLIVGLIFGSGYLLSCIK